MFDDQDFGCNLDLGLQFWFGLNSEREKWKHLENKREVEKIIEYLNKLDSGIDNLLEFVLKS